MTDKFDRHNEALELFKAAGAVLGGVRLRLEQQIAVQIAEVTSQFQEARRKFNDRKYKEASDKLSQVVGDFNGKVSQWQRKAKSLLKKYEMNPRKVQELNREVVDVEGRVTSASTILLRLKNAVLSMPEEGEHEQSPSPSPSPERRPSRPLYGDPSWLDLDE